MTQHEVDHLKIGDIVQVGECSMEFEVAEVTHYPHGMMIGIYDEPPSRHIDYWNFESVEIVRSKSE